MQTILKSLFNTPAKKTALIVTSSKRYFFFFKNRSSLVGQDLSITITLKGVKSLNEEAFERESFFSIDFESCEITNISKINRVPVSA